MSLGGTNNAVAGINLTDAELAQIQTTATGTVTIGDTSPDRQHHLHHRHAGHHGRAPRPWSCRPPSGAGQIILDDGAGTGTALNGNGGNITLTAGTGGIVARRANNTAAEIATTGATVTLEHHRPDRHQQQPHPVRRRREHGPADRIDRPDRHDE